MTSSKTKENPIGVLKSSNHVDKDQKHILRKRSQESLSQRVTQNHRTEKASEVLTPIAL
jgi:hypothetical protein